MASILKQVQQDAADTLSAHPLFANVKVVAEDLQMVAAMVLMEDQQVTVLCLVKTPNADVKYADQATPYFDSIDLTVQVIENAEVNRSQPTYTTGIELAEAVMVAIYHERPIGINEVWNPVSPTIRTTVNELGFVLSEIRLRTSGGIAYPVAQIPVITGSFDGDNVTLDGAQAGAGIFYTVDGSYPAPRKGDGTPGTLYTAPFPVTAGQKVLARAWLAGYLASDVFSLQL